MRRPSEQLPAATTTPLLLTLSRLPTPGVSTCTVTCFLTSLYQASAALAFRPCLQLPFCFIFNDQRTSGLVKGAWDCLYHARECMVVLDCLVRRRCAEAHVLLGNGGYGRLGHTVQKDEFTPKAVDALRGRMPVDKESPVSLSWASFTILIGSAVAFSVQCSFYFCDTCSQKPHKRSCI